MGNRKRRPRRDLRPNAQNQRGRRGGRVAPRLRFPEGRGLLGGRDGRRPVRRERNRPDPGRARPDRADSRPRRRARCRVRRSASRDGRSLLSRGRSGSEAERRRGGPSVAGRARPSESRFLFQHGRELGESARGVREAHPKTPRPDGGRPPRPFRRGRARDGIRNTPRALLPKTRRPERPRTELQQDGRGRRGREADALDRLAGAPLFAGARRGRGRDRRPAGVFFGAGGRAEEDPGRRPARLPALPSGRGIRALPERRDRRREFRIRRESAVGPEGAEAAVETRARRRRRGDGNDPGPAFRSRLLSREGEEALRKPRRGGSRGVPRADSPRAPG